jgi:threonyl-tRNA synthetase
MIHIKGLSSSKQESFKSQVQGSLPRSQFPSRFSSVSDTLIFVNQTFVSRFRLKMSIESVPIVDLKDLCSALSGKSPSEEDWTEATSSLREALQKIGFVYIKNHGISQEKVNFNGPIAFD